MDGTAKSIVRGRIAECVLGLCLVIAALMRPEIGAQLPAFLADLYVGPACLLVGVAAVVCVPPVIPCPERIDAAGLALRESMRAEIGSQT